MSASPFRAAVETFDIDKVVETFDENIVFYSPVMVKPYIGRETVSQLLGILLGLFEDFHYLNELSETTQDSQSDQQLADGREALIFSASVAGKALQGLDLVTYQDGKIVDLTIMVRPLPAAMVLSREVGKRLNEQEQGRTAS